MSEVLDRHSRMPRKYVPGEERERDPETGQLVAMAPELKQAILDDVKPMLLSGATLDQIAAKHNIAPRTLDYWLAAMPEEYKEIRKQWIDMKLVTSERLVIDSKDPFQLAKGREWFRIASWYAERRDPERYADKRELTVKTDEPQTDEQVRAKIQQLEAKLNIRTIEHKPEQNEQRNEAERPNALIAPALEASPS